VSLFRESQTFVPDKVFQILIVEKNRENVKFLAPLENNIASLKATYPQASHQIYYNEEIMDLISENFPSDVLDAYRALKPFAFKADLARYCLLFKFGGLYSDLSYLHVGQIALENDQKIAVFRDIPNHPSWSVSNAVICSKAGHNVLQRAIEKIVAFHKQGFTGIHSLEVTGPYMFGRVLAESSNWKDIVFGDSKFINKDDERRSNILKFMPSGKIVAIRNKTRNGSIKSLVSSGGNSYFRMWQSGNTWQQSQSATLMTRLKNLIAS
jgi:mannosyltransferase OCH1-like enzyme